MALWDSDSKGLPKNSHETLVMMTKGDSNMDDGSGKYEEMP